jgi:hypothetical protein
MAGMGPEGGGEAAGRRTGEKRRPEGGAWASRAAEASGLRRRVTARVASAGGGSSSGAFVGGFRAGRSPHLGDRRLRRSDDVRRRRCRSDARQCLEPRSEFGSDTKLRHLICWNCLRELLSAIVIYIGKQKTNQQNHIPQL